MKHKELTPQDWLAAGYNQCAVNKYTSQYASFLLQKRIDDHKGKKYFITVLTYDNQSLGLQSKWSFAPTVQFQLASDKPVVNVELITRNDKDSVVTSILDIETLLDKMWKDLGEPYYELWD